MKKFLSVLVLIGWFNLMGVAQGRPQRQPGAGLEAMKIAFITKRVDLTPEEAQRFWPIYNRYAAEVRQAYIIYRDHQNEIELEEALLNTRKKYNSDFLKVLSPEKVNLFWRADRDFGAFVQKEMQRRQNQRRPFAGDQ